MSGNQGTKNKTSWSYTEWKKRTNAPNPKQIAESAKLSDIQNGFISNHEPSVPVADLRRNYFSD